MSKNIEAFVYCAAAIAFSISGGKCDKAEAIYAVMFWILGTSMLFVALKTITR